jgi:hypothetical protein
MTIIHGVVIDNVFYSNATKLKNVNVQNGFYNLDIENDLPVSTIKPTFPDELDAFVRKSKSMWYVNGYSFKNGFIPENVMAWKKYTLPIYVNLTMANEWEHIKVLFISPANLFVYVTTLQNQLSFILFELQEAFNLDRSANTVKGATPEMKMIYTFHNMEKIKLLQSEKLKTIEGKLAYIIEQSGGKLVSYKEITGIGYQIIWQSAGEKIETVIDKDFKVIEAGFCVSGYDNTQSMSSVVKVLNDYKHEGARIVKTRTVL